MIECKHSRADFLRDDRRREILLAQREDLLRLRSCIEENQIKAFEPQLRQQGSSLFHELDDWDFAASQLPSYRSVLAKIERVERSLYRHTKFSLMAKYRLADELYIAAPRGLLKPRELPVGWGLLESRSPREDSDPRTSQDEDNLRKVVVASPLHRASEIHRGTLLRNIAVASSFAAHPVGVL